MALIKCPYCGKEMSNRASSCPQCGRVLADSVEGQQKQEREMLQKQIDTLHEEFNQLEESVKNAKNELKELIDKKKKLNDCIYILRIFAYGVVMAWIIWIFVAFIK